MSAGHIQLELVTPSKRVLTRTVDEVVAPGEAGSFGVRPGHEPFIARMSAGALRASGGEGGETLFAVGEGFVQVAQDRVLVLAETAEAAADIDPSTAKAELEAEKKKLADLKSDDATFGLQQLRVARAAAKVAVAGR